MQINIGLVIIGTVIIGLLIILIKYLNRPTPPSPHTAQPYRPSIPVSLAGYPSNSGYTGGYTGGDIAIGAVAGVAAGVLLDETLHSHDTTIVETGIVDQNVIAPVIIEQTVMEPSEHSLVEQSPVDDASNWSDASSYDSSSNWSDAPSYDSSSDSSSSGDF